MSTYISSKKIISQVVNLALLLSTTNFVIIHPVLADFEDSIDIEEQIPAVKPEDLSQNITEIQKKGAQVLEKGAQVGIHALEVVQNKIEDITHLDEIKSQRDEAINRLTQEQKKLEEFQEKITQLESELSKQQAKINDEKTKVSQLKTNLNEKDNNITSLTNEKKILLAQHDQQQKEIEELKFKQEKMKQGLGNKKLEFEEFRNRIVQNISLAQTEYSTEFDKMQGVIAAKKDEIAQLTQDLTVAQQNYKVMQDNMAALKDNYKKKKKDLSEAHLAQLEEKNNVISEKERLLNSHEERITQLTQSLNVGQKDYNAMQEDIKALQDNYEHERKTLSDAYLTKLKEINNVISEKERLLSNQQERIEQLEQEQYNRLEQDRDWSDIRSYFEQKEVNQVKDELSKESAAKIEQLKIQHQSEKMSLLTENDANLVDIAEKDKKIEQLEQERYNRLEQDRDWSDIRLYFEQQKVNELKTELSKESAAKIEQLDIQHQAEKVLLEEQINSLRTGYNAILNQTDKNLADITQDLTRHLNVAEALSQKSAKDLATTQSELTKITQENSNRELVISSLEKKLMKNARKLAESLNVNEQSSDKIKELENDKSSLEAKYNLLLSEQNQNLLQIQELEAKLLSEQAKHNNYTQQIAQVTKQNQIAKESLAKQILLQGQAMEITEDNYRQGLEILHQSRGLEANNNVQELDIFSQSRDLELNDVSSITQKKITPQTVNGVKSIASVITNSIEAASDQLYDNISSRFNGNDHIPSGDERGQMEIWVKQGVGVMNQKPIAASGEGYKGRSHGLFIGIDHECELGDKNLIGAAIALNNKSKMQLRGSQSQLMTDSNILSVYGKRHLNSQLAVSGAFSYFRATTEANNFGENIDKIKTHGTKFDVELSYNKLVSRSQSWQPFIGVSYGTISAFDMNFKDQGLVVKMKKSRLLSGKIGTRVQLKQYNLENGINVSPSLMASISKPLKIIAGNRCAVNNSILSDENNSVLTHKIKDATLNLGGDLRINRNNIDIIASYNFSMRKKYQAHQGGVKLEVKL